MSRRGTRLRRLGRATYFDCGRMKWHWQRVRFRLNVQCLELALESETRCTHDGDRYGPSGNPSFKVVIAALSPAILIRAVTLPQAGGYRCRSSGMTMR